MLGRGSVLFCDFMDQDKVKISNNTEKNGRDNEISMMRLKSMKKKRDYSVAQNFCGFFRNFSRICKNKLLQERKKYRKHFSWNNSLQSKPFSYFQSLLIDLFTDTAAILN